jgi:hypothetical protein
MPLYIVVRHPDKEQKWRNFWQGDLLDWIETNGKVAGLCERAKNANEDVFVHRCLWDEASPLICCSVKVQKIEQVGQELWQVDFTDQKPLQREPPRRPDKGDNFYQA